MHTDHKKKNTSTGHIWPAGRRLMKNLEYNFFRFSLFSLNIHVLWMLHGIGLVLRIIASIH